MTNSFLAILAAGLISAFCALPANAQIVKIDGCLSPDALRQTSAKSMPAMRIRDLDAKQFVDTYNSMPPVTAVPVPAALLVGDDPRDPTSVIFFVFESSPDCRGLALRKLYLVSRADFQKVLQAEIGI